MHVTSAGQASRARRCVVVCVCVLYMLCMWRVCVCFPLQYLRDHKAAQHEGMRLCVCVL